VKRAGKKPAKKKPAKVGKSRKSARLEPQAHGGALKREKAEVKAIDPRRREYLDNRAQGDSKKEAALKAGFSESMAENAKEKIEKPIAEQLAKAIQARIPLEKIVRRIDEGMDALETKIVQHQGIVTDYVDLVAWAERREYTAMAAEYGQYHIPHQKIEHDGEIDGTVKVVVEFLGENNEQDPRPDGDAQQDQR
jgi:hypothetical protein